MSKRQPPVSREVVIERDGKPYSGTYTVKSGVVTVSMAPWGTKSTQVGGSSAERIARLLLGELVTEHGQRKF